MRRERRPVPRRNSPLALLLLTLLLPTALAGIGAQTAQAVAPHGEPPPVLVPDTTVVAPSAPEADRVGALFVGGFGPGRHFCTAGVVPSPIGNLLLTAAHCIGSPQGVTFAPGYRDGSAPYGTWPVVRIFTTEGWTSRHDPDQDFAFLEVGADSAGREIQSVVGANPLGLNAAFTAGVRLYGYGSRADVPLLCTNTTTRFSAHQRRIHCPSYPGGTSGGPWIDTASGAVIGVIGGYQLGGDTADVSYSAYFDRTITRLYLDAQFHASIPPRVRRPSRGPADPHV
ncbi:serine protease [Kitasatospora sp. NBC_00374]|uniref:trypsin-like serine peptidase n=1 Tax=Kitasatospora sp. NBC_00374 TaxID=2975964 RepID=UPI0030DEAAB5